jgi:hypothetical protein
MANKKDVFADFLKSLSGRIGSMFESPKSEEPLPTVLWDKIDEWWESDLGVPNKFIAKGLLLAFLRSVEGVKYGGPEQEILTHTMRETERLFKDPNTRADMVVHFSPIVEQLAKTSIRLKLEGPEILIFTLMFSRVQSEIRQEMLKAMQDDVLNDDDDWENAQ